MKHLLVGLFLTVSTLHTAQAVDTSSDEYRFMRDTYNHVYQHQKLIEFLSLVVNDVMPVIESECRNIPDEENCTVNRNTSVTITPRMAEASEIFFGPGEGFDVGETLPLPAGTLIFQKLPYRTFQYAVSADLSKIPDSGMNETYTFSWNDDGNISRVFYRLNGTPYASSFVLLDRNGTKKMIANGIFDARAEGGDAGTYIMEVTLTDPTINEIVERMSFFDFSDGNNTFEVLSKGRINDNGGTVWIDIPWADGNVTFDANGNTIDWNDTVTIEPDTNNGAILDYDGEYGNFQGHNRFVIVKEGVDVGELTILGYIFKSYDSINKGGQQYEYEYFGPSILLATKGATDDQDHLDIYSLDETNKPDVNITGMWLTKEE